MLDTHTRQHIWLAAQWLADPRGKPGLMLQGLYGNGKTTLLNAMCNLINHLGYSAIRDERVSIRSVSSDDIVSVGVRDGDREAFYRLCDEPLLAIDDLGEEPAEVMSYGMVHTPVRDLLHRRYARRKITIVTTNLVNTPDKPQLRDHYGERIVDRFREMMEIIVFRNSSYRESLGKKSVSAAGDM